MERICTFKAFGGFSLPLMNIEPPQNLVLGRQLVYEICARQVPGTTLTLLKLQHIDYEKTNLEDYLTHP